MSEAGERDAAARADEILRLRRQAASRPGDPIVRAQLARVAEGAEASEAAEEAVKLARACLDAGLIATAREAAQTLLDWAPNEEAHAALAIDVALRGGDPGALIAAGDTAAAWVARAPESSVARLRAALVAAARGEAKTVGALLAPVLETSIEARLLYAQAQLCNGDPASALATVSVGDGTDARTRADLAEVAGVAWLELGHAERALDAFAAALTLAPERVSVAYNMAVAFARAGSLGAAVGACDTGLGWLAARAGGAGGRGAGAPVQAETEGERTRIEALRAALVARLAAGVAPRESSA